jgi:hypothetical protein
MRIGPYASETGHHLGGSPRDPDMTWMTWQGRADYRAARTAMPLVFGSKARQMTIRGARELFILHQDLSRLMDGDEPDLSGSCRDRIFRAGVSAREMPCCAKQLTDFYPLRTLRTRWTRPVLAHRLALLLRWIGAHYMVETWVQRRLAAVLAADVAGYSRVAARMRTAFSPTPNLSERPDRIDHRRRVVKRTGDRGIVEFSSVVDAVHCASLRLNK